MAESGANQQIATLSEVTETGMYLVVKTEGSAPELRRLQQIGLIPGMRVEVVWCPQDDMMVIKVGNGRLALARGATSNVWVRFRRPL